jgi:hypothetical protein
MAPPRKKKPAPGEGYEVKLRLPPDTMGWIEARAKAEQRPFRAVIRNQLARVPYLEQFEKLADLIRDMDSTLARYGARIVSHDMNTGLLNAVDALLEAKGGEVPAAIDRVRVIRNAMHATERSEKRMKKQ